jgi:hypothetical protein
VLINTKPKDTAEAAKAEGGGRVGDEGGGVYFSSRSGIDTK